MKPTKKIISTTEDLVLKKALFKAAKIWNLNQEDIAKIIKVDPSKISRLAKNSDKGIDPYSNDGAFVKSFLILFKSLHSFFGGRVDLEKKWLNTHNKFLGEIPIKLIEEKDPKGLMHVSAYAEAMYEGAYA